MIHFIEILRFVYNNNMQNIVNRILIIPFVTERNKPLHYIFAFTVMSENNDILRFYPVIRTQLHTVI